MESATAEKNQAINATGRRKTSIARVFLRPGSGEVTVNGKALMDYFKRETLVILIKQPIESMKNGSKFDIIADVEGGGIAGQAGALMLAIARAFVKQDAANKPILKSHKLLTRDPREKERKKYGRPGARRRFQFSKR